MLLEIDVLVVPLKAIDHDVPDGRPDSVNFTVYVTRLNVIA